MANGGTVEIEVELTGTKDIREGLGSIGEAGKTLVDSMHFSNEKLGEGIGELGESVFGLKDSFSELKTGIMSLGTTGASGLMALLGPIGAVVTAGFALYEVFKLISGAAQEAEENESAMAAAASDLQSKLEALSEKGVKPSTSELQKFSLVTIKAQIAKEKLQFAQEKLTKVTIAAYEADEKARKAQEQLNQSMQITTVTSGQLTVDKQRLTQATTEQTEANNKLAAALSKFRNQQEAANKKIKEGAKLEKELEERSADFLQGKVKENIEKLKGLQLMEQEKNLTEEVFNIAQVAIEKEAALAIVKAESNEENADALLRQNKELEKRIKLIDRDALIKEVAVKKEMEAEQAIEDKRKQVAKAQLDRAKQLATAREAEAQKEKQRQLKLFIEQTRIQQLEIEAQENSTNKSIQLIELRYNTALSLAKDNANQVKIAELTLQNELTQLYAQEDQKRLDQQRATEEQRKAFEFETRAFDIAQMQEGTQRELEELQLKYDREFELAKGNEERILELKRRFSIESTKIMKSETSELSIRFKELFTNMGQGMAEAAAGALIMGDSFKASVVQVLQSLAKSALVEGLIETAKGVAMSFVNPAEAGTHFAAAAAFGAAAAAAGGASAALGGGGGGGTGGGSFSPSGSPQSAQAPMREEATQSSMVFNVNFSGAVVYDTKKAAEQALADRITRVMNQNRRGTPRR